MIRFILKREYKPSYEMGPATSSLYTIDAECPELEAQLRRGGCGNGGWDFADVVGSELLKETAPDAPSPAVPDTRMEALIKAARAVCDLAAGGEDTELIIAFAELRAALEALDR